MTQLQPLRSSAGGVCFRPADCPALAAGSNKQQSVAIPTPEFFGYVEERIDLPASCEVNVMKMAGHDAAPLASVEIRRRIPSSSN